MTVLLDPLSPVTLVFGDRACETCATDSSLMDQATRAAAHSSSAVPGVLSAPKAPGPTGQVKALTSLRAALRHAEPGPEQTQLQRWRRSLRCVTASLFGRGLGRGVSVGRLGERLGRRQHQGGDEQECLDDGQDGRSVGMTNYTRKHGCLSSADGVIVTDGPTWPGCPRGPGRGGGGVPASQSWLGSDADDSLSVGRHRTSIKGAPVPSGHMR